MRDHRLSRRRFLSGSAGLALGTAASLARARGANDRIRLACIGCGSRGRALMGEAQQFAKELNVEFVAVCDVWRPARESATAAVKGWTGRDPKAFSRYQDLLALPEVDAVTIATPDFAHSPILAAAARAGKDAYCEKPMATKLEDAKAAVKAVEEGKRVVQIGTQRRSEGRYKGAAALIQSGVLGVISEVECFYHDASPRWARSYADVKEQDVDWEQYLMGLPARPFDPVRYRRWHFFKDYTVGTVGLLGSHAIDAVTWCMADPLPKSAVALGGIYVWKDGREHADTVDCLFEFPKGWLLNYSTRLGNSRAVGDAIFYGTKGSFDTATWKATGAGGGKDKLTEEIAATPQPNESHMRNWLECLRSRKTPNAPIEAGYAHSVASIMAFAALETGRRQVYDFEKQEIRPG